MKGYTSLEQSKKLIELGIDRKTSDMFYWYGEDIIRVGGYEKQSEYFDIPAWSLASLLSVLPLECGMHKQTDDSLTYYYVEYPCKIKKKYLFSKRHDNPIDACYEMMLKLHEEKLL